METATFVIAVLGVVLASASIGWQVALFLLTGARVKVEVGEGIMFPRQGREEDVLRVTVRNVGRQAVSVTHFWLQLTTEDSWLIQPNPHPLNPQLPYTLAPGHHVSWLHAASDLWDYMARQELGEMPVRGGVSLGTGKNATSERVVTIKRP